jgi:hypothetical protein
MFLSDMLQRFCRQRHSPLAIKAFAYAPPESYLS